MRTLFVACLTVCAAQLEGQVAARVRSEVRTVGLPFLHDVGPRLAFVRDRKVAMASWRREHAIDRTGGAIVYYFEVPVAVVIPPRVPGTYQCVGVGGASGVGYAQRCPDVDQSKRPVWGVGFNPIGLRIRPSTPSPVRPFFGLALGAAVFDRHTPVARASAINFAGSFDVGAEVARGSGGYAMVAWRFQHWSNAGTAQRNPGLDANILYMGLGRRIRR